MARRKQREIPPELARGRDRFTAWRRTRRPKARIPEALWEFAVRLACGLGSDWVFPPVPAHADRLDVRALDARRDWRTA